MCYYWMKNQYYIMLYFRHADLPPLDSGKSFALTTYHKAYLAAIQFA